MIDSDRSSINGPFFIATSNNQRVYIYVYIYITHRTRKNDGSIGDLKWMIIVSRDSGNEQW